MLRTPRSLNVQAIVDPAGDAIRLSGVGRLSTCSTVNGPGAGACARPIAPATPAMIAADIRARATLRLRIVGELYAAVRPGNLPASAARHSGRSRSNVVRLPGS